MSFGDVFSTKVIVIIGVLLLIGTIIPGIRLYWPRRTDPVSRSDLGVALMGGALIAFAVLVLQLMIQIRSEFDANEREKQAHRQELLLILGQSRNLSGLDLRKEDLTEAPLNGKVLRGALLTDVPMHEASLQGADLVAANLAGADLARARLDRADLRYADLRGAILANASLDGAKLGAADLSPRRNGKKLKPVDLSGADLSNASARANLSHADLSHAKLVGSRLRAADLQKADLTGANLEFADLRGAQLQGAILVGANLSNADLSSARFDADTQWPRGFKWLEEDPRKWLVRGELPDASEHPYQFPPEVDAMRDELAKATTVADCVPGWVVAERPFTIEAREPLQRARFHILAVTLDSYIEADEWARSYPREEYKNIRVIEPITVDGARDVYAEAFEQKIGKQPTQAMVATYFVRRSLDGWRYFQLWGAAWKGTFDLFHHDFTTLFRVLGVKGNFFPSSPAEKQRCPV